MLLRAIRHYVRNIISNRLASGFISLIFPDALTHFSRNSGKIYLTFDDGPDPVITPALLGILEKKGVAATFFCLGEKAVVNKELFRIISEKEHSVGTHGYKHLNAWKANRNVYLENLYKTQDVIPGNLFRPPYGKMSRKLYHIISGEYKIVMWSLMSFDYVANVTAENCLRHLRSHTRPGDIVVFHDNGKVNFDLVPVVSEYIDFCRSKGYEFSVIL